MSNPPWKIYEGKTASPHRGEPAAVHRRVALPTDVVLQSLWHCLPAALRDRTLKYEMRANEEDAPPANEDQARLRRLWRSSPRNGPEIAAASSEVLRIARETCAAYARLILCHQRWSQPIPKASRRIIVRPTLPRQLRCCWLVPGNGLPARFCNRRDAGVPRELAVQVRH